MAPLTTPRLRYEIGIAEANAHLLEVELRLEAPAGEALPDVVTLFMPVWTPGSYLVREYARHVEGFRAETPRGPARSRKVRKNAWAVETGKAGVLVARYRLYANELTVRTNHVDASHAFWNGASTYLVPEHLAEQGLEAAVAVKAPEGWSVGTALRSAGDRTFHASSLDELMDCPFECGPMEKRVFKAHGRDHELWVWANRHASQVDWGKVIDDSRTIVEAEAKLLAGDQPPEKALPYERYSFLWHVSPRGRGGLEHAASCSLLVSPTLFSTRGGYLDVLSLVAHEVFHLWNVKRIRPEGLTPYRYEQENYTRQLWWFEGGTSYFDWRVLRLAGLCSVREYGDHLAGELARLADTPGALVHPLEEASFDAWVKAYRPDESSVNTTVSYYLKGEVVCALLDIEIRHRTGGKRSLDDVLRRLWRQYGEPGVAVPEDGLEAAFFEATGVDVSDLFAAWVRSAERVDAGPVLAKVGLYHERKPHPRSSTASLGVRLRSRSGKPVIDAVYRGGAAMRAGLDPGDELLAIAGRKVEEGGYESALHGLHAGSEVEVLFARDGGVDSRKVVLDGPMQSDGRLLLRDDATPAQLALLDGWLGQGAATALRGLS